MTETLVGAAIQMRKLMVTVTNKSAILASHRTDLDMRIKKLQYRISNETMTSEGLIESQAYRDAYLFTKKVLDEL
jgi:hypothetical protein